MQTDLDALGSAVRPGCRQNKGWIAAAKAAMVDVVMGVDLLVVVMDG